MSLFGLTDGFGGQSKMLQHLWHINLTISLASQTSQQLESYFTSYMKSKG